MRRRRLSRVERYYNEVLANQYITGLWRFDRASAHDLTRFRSDGVYSGSPDITKPGPLAEGVDLAMTCDGTDDRAAVADGANVDLGDSFMLECWFLTLRAIDDTVYRAMLGKGTGAYEFQVQGDSGFDSSLSVLKPGTADGYVTTATYTNLTNPGWHHGLAWHNGTTNSTIIVDGAEQSSVATASITCADNASSLVIGSSTTTPNNMWKGSLWAPAIYKGSVTKAYALTLARHHYALGRGA